MAWQRFFEFALIAIFLVSLGIGMSTAAEAPALTPPKPFLLDTSKDPRLTQGVNLFLQKKYFEACGALAAVVDQTTMDSTARGAYALALSGAGRNKEARRQLSIAINWMPGWIEGYNIRALCASRMGSVGQAKRDLEISRQLDPADTLKSRSAIEPMVLEALKGAPAEPPAALHQALLKAAREGEPLERLIERAARLLKASNVDRKFGDEDYSERRRLLQWALTAAPQDPNRLAALGNFLVDEVEARGDFVEPTQYTINYRLQDKAHQEADLALARKCFGSALAMNPGHVPSLSGLARIEFRANMWANAEGYLRRALAVGTVDREVLWMLRDILQIAAGQQMARAIGLRWTNTWEETIGNTLYEVTEPPTAEDIRQAGLAEGHAASFLAQSHLYLRRAIKTLGNDAASHDFAGNMAYQFKDYAAARKAWEQAVKLAPKIREYRYSLSNAYARLNMDEQYLEQAIIGRNMEHTAASTELHWAWRTINAGNADAAATLLERAVKTDPADPRTLAYMAVLAEEKHEAAEALALYRAALALDEAHALEDGCSWLTGAGRWFVNDIGRAIELRSRIPGAIEPRDPKAAADLYLANVKLESMIGDPALKEPVHTAMMPLFGIGDRRRQDAPFFGELERTSRALGAAALVKAKQCAAAAEHFRMLPGYESRHRAAGGKQLYKLRDEVWSSAQVVAAAVECFQNVNDPQSLTYWQNKRVRGGGDAGTRIQPTSPQPATKGVRR
jgi:Tfp pilus assembly protein PilF